MADPTAVNSQITDAVTQSNVKVVAESPAHAIGMLYQTLAHSTGILFQKAVAAQQQQSALAQAATNQGILQIYSVDTVAGANATERPTATPESLLSRASLAADELNASRAGRVGIDVTPLIQDQVKFSNASVLGSAGDVAYALRIGTDAATASLDSVSKALHDDLMRTLRTAATAATLEAMLRDPSKSEEFEAVLQVIKRME